MAPSSNAHASTLADLTGSVRRTTGEVPPPLVGASTTVLRNKLYLFGGRLVPTRTMINSLFCLDFETLVWVQLWPPKDVKVKVSDTGEHIEELEDSPANMNGGGTVTVRGPQARYFHSCDVWGDSLLIFGGMGYQNNSSRAQSPAGSVHSRTSNRSGREENPDSGLCVLSDIIMYDTIRGTWSFPELPVTSTSLGTGSPSASPVHSITPMGPSPRYAHLSCIANGCLVVIGGQDLGNRYLQEVSVLDLERMVWLETRRYEGHCGTYRSVAMSRPTSVHYPQDASRRQSLASSIRSGKDELDPNAANIVGDLIQQPYSAAPTLDKPEPVFLYSNFNFSAVKRALDLITAPKPPHFSCPVTHLSHLMSNGPNLPPGLRFPTGAIIGGHMVIAGTFLSASSSSFAIWALDLANYSRGSRLTWSRVDPGGMMGGGASWNKAVAWRNSLVVLGDRDRQISEDYDHRQTNFLHCAFVDLEAFGVYHPPPRLMPLAAQELALLLLNNLALADFEVICSDGRKIPCNRKILEERWPWFKKQLGEFKTKASLALNSYRSQQPVTSRETNAGVSTNGGASKTSPKKDATTSDLRMTPRTLHLPEPFDVALSAIQYFYTLSLCTPLQHQLSVLVGLILFSRTYNEENLRALCVHAMHGLLLVGPTNAPAQIYEAATLAGCIALQVRSLKQLMYATKGRQTSSAEPKS